MTVDHRLQFMFIEDHCLAPPDVEEDIVYAMGPTNYARSLGDGNASLGFLCWNGNVRRLLVSKPGLLDAFGSPVSEELLTKSWQDVDEVGFSAEAVPLCEVMESSFRMLTSCQVHHTTLEVWLKWTDDVQKLNEVKDVRSPFADNPRYAARYNKVATRSGAASSRASERDFVKETRGLRIPILYNYGTGECEGLLSHNGDNAAVITLVLPSSVALPTGMQAEIIYRDVKIAGSNCCD